MKTLAVLLLLPLLSGCLDAPPVDAASASPGAPEPACERVTSGHLLSVLDGLLLANHIDVEPFGPTHGLRFAARVHDDGRWRRHAHDALIAGHLGPDDELWTSNVEDFVAVGVPREQVVAVWFKYEVRHGPSMARPVVDGTVQPAAARPAGGRR